MKLFPNYLAFFAFSSSSILGSEIGNELTVDQTINSVHVVNPLSLTQRRPAIIRRNSVNVDEEGKTIEEPSHSYDEYDVKVFGGSDTDNPLPSSRKKPFTSAKKSRKTRTTEQQPIESSSTEASEIPAASRPLPFMPVDKPIAPTYSGADLSEEEESDAEEVGIEDLLRMIPDRFSVTETSGTYGINEDDAFVTSAEVMKKRSALYRLLSEVYMSFDTFDFDGFMQFLRKAKCAMRHLDLRYHLIENLVKRSAKTSNEGTLDLLSRLIQMIDSASVKWTAGKEELDNLRYFEKRIEDLKKKNQLSAIINSVMTEFFMNEKKRLDPLQESLLSGDYNTAKGIIESSNNSVFVSANDFIRMLDLPCSSARFYFVSWAIENGHFNAHERFDSDLMTPLMLAAQCPRWSNDIVKAILLKAPDTQNLKSSEDLNALNYAKNNKSLEKVFRLSLIEMLELENPSEKALDHVLNKYIK